MIKNVVLDAGGGGIDVSLINTLSRDSEEFESYINRVITRYLENSLKNTNLESYKTIHHDVKVNPTLKSRLQNIEKYNSKETLVLSVHSNKNIDIFEDFEIYHNNKASRIAESITDELIPYFFKNNISYSKYHKTDSKNKEHLFIKKLECPAIYLGFLPYNDDTISQYFSKPDIIKTISDKIVEGILHYNKLYK